REEVGLDGVELVGGDGRGVTRDLARARRPLRPLGRPFPFGGWGVLEGRLPAAAAPCADGDRRPPRPGRRSVERHLPPAVAARADGDRRGGARWRGLL